MAILAVGLLDKLLVVLGAHAVLESLLHHFYNAVKRRFFLMCFSAEEACHFVFFDSRAVQKHIVRLLGKVLYRQIKRKTESLPDRAEKRPVPALLFKALEAVDVYRTLGKRKIFVGNYPLDRDPSRLTESRAVRACALRIVEREHSRLKFAYRNSVFLAGIRLRKRKHFALALLLSALDGYDQKMPVRKRERGLNRIGKTRAYSLTHHKSVNDHLNRVFFVFIKFYFFRKVV